MKPDTEAKIYEDILMESTYDMVEDIINDEDIDIDISEEDMKKLSVEDDIYMPNEVEVASLVDDKFTPEELKPIHDIAEKNSVRSMADKYDVSIRYPESESDEFAGDIITKISTMDTKEEY